MMGAYLNHFTQATISLDDFALGLDNLFNSNSSKDPNDVVALKKIAFGLYDINKDNKLSENDLFELMKMSSIQGPKGKGED